ncbi:hypothetical protein GN956_G10683 [Arapaima gigas]
MKIKNQRSAKGSASSPCWAEEQQCHLLEPGERAEKRQPGPASSPKNYSDITEVETPRPQLINTQRQPMGSCSWLHFTARMC